MNKIKVLAVTHHDRTNINPIRPEASQIISMHNSGKVKITVMCNPGSQLIQYFSNHGIEVITDPLDKKLSLRTIKRIRKEIKLKNIDILHLYNNIACSNGATAALGLPVKVIAYRGQTGNVSRFDPTCYLTMLHPRLDRIICVAKAVEDDLAKYVYNPEKKLKTVYKGHDQSWYTKPKADLSSLNFSNNDFIISLVANLRPRKGLHVLMDATHYLPKGSSIKILLVGADPKNEKIKKIISESGCPENIFPLGYRTDAPEVAAASDLTVLPTTKREGLCRAVLEANSYGTPAVVSDTGGNAELVAHGETGIVVPPGDAKALAGAIIELYQDREKCIQYGKAARTRVIELFDVEQGVESTLSIYNELISEK
ncbi:glycosyltransferase [uncultured Ferrimonas sp.]|uniref:glycosyltransferase n=1 Tax=uncultured Ferrimonas sp. TaxID=432640 RepID=UPI0026311089|nr:glycosyltransferase [uncultured Ferrimonas sp.]